MKQRGLVYFALFVFFVVGFVVWDYLSDQRKSDFQSEQSKLIKTSLQTVSSFSFLDAQKAGFKLQQEAGKWLLDNPSEEVFTPNLEAFWGELELEKVTAVVQENDAIDWKIYGLDVPKGYLRIQYQNGQEDVFAVSTKKNFEGQVYLRRNSENKVLLVGPNWNRFVEKTAKNFRDLRLMRFEVQEVLSLQRSVQNQKLVLKVEEGRWKAQGLDWDLDQSKVRGIVEKLNSVEALDFVSDESPSPDKFGALGLKKLEAQLKVELKDQTMWEADFFDGGPEFWLVHVKRPGLVMKIDRNESVALINPTVTDLRDKKKPFEFNALNAQSVEVKTPSIEFVLAKSEKSGWVSNNQMAERTFDPEIAGKLVSAIRDLEAKSFEGSKWAHKLKNPDWELTVKNQEGSVLLQLKISALGKETSINSNQDVNQKDSVKSSDYVVQSSASKDVVVISESLFKTLKVDEIWRVKQTSDQQGNDKND